MNMFLILKSHLFSLFVKFLFKSILHFSIGFLALCPSIFKSSLYTRVINLLWHIYCKCFLPVFHLSFHQFTIFYLHFIQSNLSLLLLLLLLHLDFESWLERLSLGGGKKKSIHTCVVSLFCVQISNPFRVYSCVWYEV